MLLFTGETRCWFITSPENFRGPGTRRTTTVGQVLGGVVVVSVSPRLARVFRLYGLDGQLHLVVVPAATASLGLASRKVAGDLGYGVGRSRRVASVTACQGEAEA
jgi:hypothetical protein